MKRIERYRKTEEIKDIDKDIAPLVSVLNHWKKHRDGHYTGIATTWSCSGHPYEQNNYAYLLFHCSQSPAEQLRIVLRQFKHKIKWDIGFDGRNFIMKPEDKAKEADYGIVKESILQLSRHILKKFRIDIHDKGWRVFTLPDRMDLRGISEVTTEDSFSDIVKDMLEYIISSDKKLKKRMLMKFIFEKYANKRKNNAAFERLKAYQFIEEKAGQVLLKKRMKTTRQILKTAAERRSNRITCGEI